MKTKTKRNLIISGITFFFLINIAGFGTLIYLNYFEGSATTKEDFQFKPGHENMKLYIKNKLNLNENQFKKFREIRSKSRQHHRSLVRKIHHKQGRLMNELGVESPDTNRLYVLADSIGKLHTRLKKETIHHFMNMRALCNEKQEDRLQEFLQELKSHSGCGRKSRRWHQRKGRQHPSFNNK